MCFRSVLLMVLPIYVITILSERSAQRGAFVHGTLSPDVSGLYLACTKLNVHISPLSYHMVMGHIRKDLSDTYQKDVRRISHIRRVSGGSQHGYWYPQCAQS